MSENFKERLLQNSVALLLIFMGLSTWFFGGKTSDAKELCIALIGSGTTYLIGSGNRGGKKAQTVVEDAREVNIEEKS